MNQTTYEAWAWQRLTALVNEGQNHLRTLRNMFAVAAREGRVTTQEERAAAEHAIYAD